MRPILSYFCAICSSKSRARPCMMAPSNTHKRVRILSDWAWLESSLCSFYNCCSRSACLWGSFFYIYSKVLFLSNICSLKDLLLYARLLSLLYISLSTSVSSLDCLCPLSTFLFYFVLLDGMIPIEPSGSDSYTSDSLTSRKSIFRSNGRMLSLS